MESPEQHTLAILKPDSFWRQLDIEVAARIRHLGLTVVGECRLAGVENLSAEQWQAFYFPAIGDKPSILKGTAQYMAFGPVLAIHLRGADAIRKLRAAAGATRPWQAEKGTIRGDYWPGADAANAPYRAKFEQPGDGNFLFNLIHSSDSPESFAREIAFFARLQ